MSESLSYIKDLDYSILQQCMHCGMCLPTCPTYESTLIERNSPRGRIALMRAIADGELTAGEAFADEMYFCLGCLACVSACPAGVDYATLFENARAESEATGAKDSALRKIIRAVTLRWLFMEAPRLQLAGFALRTWQSSGLQSFVRASGMLRLLPKRLRDLEAMTPKVCDGITTDYVAIVTSARGERRYRVAMLTGCVQDLIFSDVNRDTVEVLAENGCEVHTPADQPCCGSLHAHNGELELARGLARRQIDLFPPSQYDAIITNAAGCGSHLKHFHGLLAEDLAYAELARSWDAKVRDIHEWLVEIGFRAPVESGCDRKRVTYHEACHLCHGQKISRQPREVLGAVPGVELAELPESTWCCGSAGIYNLIQPEMAGELLDRKVKHIQSTEAEMVATGNPGCLLHIANGLAKHGSQVATAHPVSLLAEAYRNEKAPGEPEGFSRE